MANHTKKVLIVEDGDDWRQLLALVIKSLGYEVFEAATGLEAIYQASAAHPDLILTDLGLPGMSGDEVMVQLKMHPSTRDIPVVVQTAYAAGAVLNRAVEAGAAEILLKPVDLRTLCHVLHKYLSAKNQTAQPIATIC
jgi:CheY-like chemotaxis protein